MNFNEINQILNAYATQFIQDEYHYYQEKYISFLRLYPLCSWQKEAVENEAYDMFQEITDKIDLPFVNVYFVQSIVNSHTTIVLSNYKHYTHKMLFVTFRPPEDMDMDEYKDVVESYFCKEIIRSFICVHEQKGNSYATLGQGKHFHAIVQFKFKSEFKSYKQQTKDFLKKFGMVDLVDIYSNQMLLDKFIYMGLLLVSENVNEIVVNPYFTYKRHDKNDCLEYDRIHQERNELYRSHRNENYIIEAINQGMQNN